LKEKDSRPFVSSRSLLPFFAGYCGIQGNCSKEHSFFYFSILWYNIENNKLNLCKRYPLFRSPFFFIMTVLLTLGLSISFQSLLAAWTEPGSTPPGGNVDFGFLDKSSTNQEKLGGLIINGAGQPNGLVVRSGNVGIGATSPGQILELARDDQDIAIRFHDPMTRWYTMGIHYADGGKFKLAHGGNIDDFNLLTVLPNGQVGIGTANPSSDLKLDVEGKVGATQYCDSNGSNCRAITEMGGGTPHPASYAPFTRYRLCSGSVLGEVPISFMSSFDCFQYCSNLNASCCERVTSVACSDCAKPAFKRVELYTKNIPDEGYGTNLSYFACVRVK
jgi:hypothetical protein